MPLNLRNCRRRFGIAADAWKLPLGIDADAAAHAAAGNLLQPLAAHAHAAALADQAETCGSCGSDDDISATQATSFF